MRIRCRLVRFGYLLGNVLSIARANSSGSDRLHFMYWVGGMVRSGLWQPLGGGLHTNRVSHKSCGASYPGKGVLAVDSCDSYLRIFIECVVSS